jgi:molybdate transport system substrate-binding protein
MPGSSPRRRGAVTCVLILLLCGPAACGSEPSPHSGSSTPSLSVSAASSLTAAFTAYGEKFTDADAKFSFGGSDDLAAQIRQGIHPDVFASANTSLPDDLYRAGLVEKPTVFAGNRFVIAVPSDDDSIHSVADLAEPGVTIAAGSPSVPIGSYTRESLARLPAGEAEAIEGNIASNEPDVAGIVGKLTQGAVDAAFVYVTDVKATNGKLRAIELPASLQPVVAYGAAVVKGSEHPAQAEAFIHGLLHGAGRKALDDAGFLPPPAGAG